MKHLIALTEELRAKGVNFRSLTDSIDTSTPMGRFFFHMMGALAEIYDIGLSTIYRYHPVGTVITQPEM